MGWAFPAAAIFRYHNNPALWAEFVDKKLIKPGKTPNWKALGELLEEKWATKGKVFGGLYHPPVLRSYSTNGGTTWRDPPFNLAKRDILAMQLLWEAAPSRELKAYEANPGMETFTDLYSEFKAKIQACTKGLVGNYGLKVILDLMVLGGWVCDAHLAMWPADCPGYISGLNHLFRRLPSTLRLNALLFVHRELNGKCALTFPESAAQLCWAKRRRAGSLRDSRNHC